MIQPLNFAPKAILALEGLAAHMPPLSAVGYRYLAAKLRQAQVFLLPDHGQIFDRQKTRPDVPFDFFRPPFPVVALEYESPPTKIESPLMPTPAPKRIALAWEWTDDLPSALRPQPFAPYPPGVVVASIFYVPEPGAWMAAAAVGHIAYGDRHSAAQGQGPIARSLRECGRMSPTQVSTPFRPLFLFPEMVDACAAQFGTMSVADRLCADLMDEFNAYTDVCLALACGNVGFERHPAPSKLNRARLRSGKLPLFDTHILKLMGAGESGGFAGEHDGRSPRPHLRRGHIRHLRHLGEGRFTWVNASVVRGHGRGFAHKDYAIGAGA